MMKRKIKISAAISVGLFVALYACFAYSLAEFNPMEWDIFNRTFHSFLWLMGSILSLPIIFSSEL